MDVASALFITIPIKFLDLNWLPPAPQANKAIVTKKLN